MTTRKLKSKPKTVGKPKAERRVERVVSLPPHIKDYLRLFNEYKVAFQSFLGRQDFEEAAKWSKAKSTMAVSICDELTKWQANNAILNNFHSNATLRTNDAGKIGADARCQGAEADGWPVS